MGFPGDTGAVAHGAREGSAVSLTFDDGPGRSTEEVLRVLDLHGERATFFMVGSQAERYPHIARRVVSAGHEVGSHTFSHLDHHAVAPHEAVSDMVAGAEAIAGVVGFEPQLYRAPYGHFVPETAAEAERRGWRCIFWSALGYDWEVEATPRSVADRVLDDLVPGAIVLLHEPVTGATVILLDEIGRRGLRAVPVGDIL
jgi:peptidoglycan/xylan/chitin deacetylase (PgdA/CDA1 family)